MKNTQGITQEFDVKPEETMKEFVARVEQLGSMEKVKINMIQHSCTCNNDLTDILLEDISKDINVHINFQHEIMDSDNTKSTSEINAMYQELRYKQLKENVMQGVKKEFNLYFRQRLSNMELQFYDRIAQLESLVENTNKLQTDQLLKELDTKNNILTKLLDENILRKFSSSPSQNNIIGGLTIEPCNNLEDLHENSPPQCQDQYPNAQEECLNRLEKENAIKILQNKIINDQLMEVRKHVIKSIC